MFREEKRQVKELIRLYKADEIGKNWLMTTFIEDLLRKKYNKNKKNVRISGVKKVGNKNKKSADIGRKPNERKSNPNEDLKWEELLKILLYPKELKVVEKLPEKKDCITDPTVYCAKSTDNMLKIRYLGKDYKNALQKLLPDNLEVLKKEAKKYLEKMVKSGKLKFVSKSKPNPTYNVIVFDKNGRHFTALIHKRNENKDEFLYLDTLNGNMPAQCRDTLKKLFPDAVIYDACMKDRQPNSNDCGFYMYDFVIVSINLSKKGSSFSEIMELAKEGDKFFRRRDSEKMRHKVDRILKNIYNNWHNVICYDYESKKKVLVAIFSVKSLLKYAEESKELVATLAELNDHVLNEYYKKQPKLKEIINAYKSKNDNKDVLDKKEINDKFSMFKPKSEVDYRKNKKTITEKQSLLIKNAEEKNSCKVETQSDSNNFDYDSDSDSKSKCCCW